MSRSSWMNWNKLYQSVDGEGGKSAFQRSFMASVRTNRSCTLKGIGQDRGNLNLPACVFTLGTRSKNKYS
jgi:hypothetical protein